MATKWLECAQCREPIALTTAQEENLRRSSAHFYCLWGHSNYFPKGETEADKLRRERDRLKQQMAQAEENRKAWEDEASRAWERERTAKAQARAFKGQATKLRRRAAAGTCACCTRTFSNLAEHMRKEHPDFVSEAQVDLAATESTAL